MKMVKLWKVVAVSSILLLGAMTLKGGNCLSNNFIRSVRIGSTTYDEILKADPSTKAIVTSYGYTTFHELKDGTKASIRFVYNDGDFVATSISTTSN